MTKRELRAAQIARREALPADQRAAATAAIIGRVRRLPAWERAHCVLSYMAFGTELSLAELHRALLQRGGTLVTPKIPHKSKELELRTVADLDRHLAPGKWGIPEPVPELCPLADLATIELILVPGVAFDRFGNRLGYGAGFYDRLFQRLPRGALRIACAYDAAIVDRVPSEAHDQQVDLLVTESMAWVCQRG